MTNQISKKLTENFDHQLRNIEGSLSSRPLFSRQYGLDTDQITRRTLTSRVDTTSEPMNLKTHKDQILNSILHASKKKTQNHQEGAGTHDKTKQL